MYIPDAKNNNWLLTQEECFLIFQLEFIVLTLTVNTGVLKLLRLQHNKHIQLN